MYRNKLTLYDVGLKLDSAGKLAFCKESEAFALTNLIVEFECDYAGKEEDGAICFEFKFVSSAWFYHGEKDAQHFTGNFDGRPEVNPLHVAAISFVCAHYWEEMNETAYDAMISAPAPQFDDAHAFEVAI